MINNNEENQALTNNLLDENFGNINLNKKLMLSTGDIKKDYDILGLVFGNSVSSKNVFKDMGAQLKSIVGGKIGSYEKLLFESREKAKNQMIKNAILLKADGIIFIKQSTSAIMQQASEVSFMGTAIKFK
ncbi:MAG: hypothetical protein HPAVJP_2310 [Candidatus Hepatoplasma vulgare]|nr:MAG: hypothetical protein HPAVJP_2310 [Candidatus Hepatoplasma sp.]